jgi:NAD(P)-dependent dehydrogenase (short-subunit alcohol dehydrogenase family)
MELGLKDKVAVVTGASAGIGYATALAFLAEGAGVAVCARGAQELAAAENRLATHGTVFAMAVDATDREQVEAFAAAAYAHFGRIDCWVNNVGASRPRSGGDDYTPEDIRWHTDMCFATAVYGCQAAAKYMKAGGGAIVNISSLAARCGTAGRSTLYGPLKAAVAGLAVTFAGELAAWGIRVNAVLPGFTATAAVAASIPDEELAANKSRTLLRRVADPNDIAGPVVFLCGDAAAGITAATLEVSGGNSVVLNPGYSWNRRLGACEP